MPKKLDLVSCYDGFVELVNFLAPTLEWITTDVEPKSNLSIPDVQPLPGPSYDHTDVSIEDILAGIIWESCTRLQTVQISCRRPLSFNPSAFVAIKPLVYPPDMADAKQQKDLDLAWFPTLVERLFSLVSRRPWITVVFPGLNHTENTKMKQEMTGPFNHAVTAHWRKAQTTMPGSST